MNQGGVRDRFTVIEKSFIRKMPAEERKIGTNPEPTELDQTIENNIERSEGAQIRGDQ